MHPLVPQTRTSVIMRAEKMAIYYYTVPRLQPFIFETFRQPVDSGTSQCVDKKLASYISECSVTMTTLSSTNGAITLSRLNFSGYVG